MMIKPRHLKQGDKVAAVALSWGGAGSMPHRYDAGKRQFESEYGLTVVEMPHTLRDAAWIAKNPRARADDLMQAFSDSSISAVISTIGGDDSIRILPYLDLDVIRANPKIFCGYSDSTVSHFVCNKANLVSFYGPSFMSGFGENCGMHRYLADSFSRLTFGTEAAGVIAPNADGWTVEFLDWAEPANMKIKRKLQPCAGWKWLQGEAVVRGALVGGCIEVVDWMRGTGYWPDTSRWKDSIIFFETSEEAIPPGQVGRLLRIFGACGMFESARAVLFGRPGGHNNAATSADYDKAILGVLNGELGLSSLPIITEMDFGHTDPFMTLPYGVQAEVDCEKRRFSICESAVS